MIWKNPLASAPLLRIDSWHSTHLKTMSSLRFAALVHTLAAMSLLSGTLRAAAPTEVRSWKSVTGSTIEARATSFQDGVATLETPSGRVLQVPSAKLAPEERSFLDEHFGRTGVGETKDEGGPAALAHPLGKVAGPIAAGGSHYFLYLPKSLKTGRTAPLLFFTNSGGGNPGRLSAMLEGSEICGWILAISVESKNGMDVPESVAHCSNCVSHIKETLPVDPKRVYFSGTSGGSREAFENSVAMDSAGVLAIIAGAQPGQVNRRKHYFFISGATDYNRYGTAKSFSEAKSSAAFRFHPKGHTFGPEWLVTEGMVWLESKWHQKTNTRDAARADFETAALDWVETMKDVEPWRAAWWARQLTDDGLMLPASLARAAALTKELGTQADAVGYAKAIKELEDFAVKELSEGPNYSPGCFNHTTPGIRKEAEKLLLRHGGVPWVKDICAALGNPTDKP